MSPLRPEKRESALRGRVEWPSFESACLAGNPLGDPHVREVPVYLPPAAIDGEPLPVAFLLSGFTGRGQAMLETHPWKRGAVAQYDDYLVSSGERGAILVMPDAFTRLGGSQYVNSAAVGQYADYVADELTAFVDDQYRTAASRRIVCGKSSGGFGALHLAMTKPGRFQVAGSISGDCAFELPLGHEIVAAARALLPYSGDPRTWMDDFENDFSLSGDGHAAINVIAMSACYAPSEDSEFGFDLPFDPKTARRREDVWQRFLGFDPVVVARDHVAELKALDGLYLEAGLKDEFGLQFGLRQLVEELQRLGIPHEHVEHDGGHFGLDRRYVEVLPRLVAMLK
ncbi:S-formylglutathione hydrolase FrmB [Planctomycetes bacterium Poly30]|uniref:S-formylglutathione hydrolase FrmB n=1 Tax=Saltatorellus ferox TaxID=2528018 RepID=A0A518EUK4_9BACT|nr:S-formylglutathione hydrolase FrmB [Planctomycetes bacterium Poly30]